MDVDYDKMWEEIINRAKASKTEVPSWAKTKKQFMNETGMTEWETDRYLEKEINEGRLVRVRHKNVFYYYPSIEYCWYNFI